MLKATLIICLFLSPNLTYSQSNQAWIDSVLTKVILNEIAIFDEHLKLIKSSEITLITTDTVVNCVWTRPKYINNVLQYEFDGILVEEPIALDTITNKSNSQFIDFQFQQFEPNGTFIKNQTLFSIERNPKKLLKHPNSDYLQLLQNTVWANSQIVSNSKQIDLDSCHKAYRLVLNENSSFEQYYGNFQPSCSTEFMEENIKVGVESNDDSFLKYYNKLQGHYLDVAQGVWVIEEDYLKLVDLNTKKVLTFSIEKLSNTELHLKAAKLDYLIKMKKAN